MDLDLSNIPTDPKALVIYLIVAAVGWYLRHRGVMKPKDADGPLLSLIKERLAQRLAEKERVESAKVVKELIADDEGK
jgi:hypothetical protein